MSKRWQPSRRDIVGYWALAITFLVALLLAAAQLWAFILAAVEGHWRWTLLIWVAGGSVVAGITGWQVGKRGKRLKPHMDRARGQRRRKKARKVREKKKKGH